ncbi:uncharacterized protein LOC126672637 [Mercurialis annua]|uniref:uncharacterized protein LOC126672637 n=1 Tax=Mercurialis annua TaxID=3986 RepID=UPI00215E8A0C|nr:uncharacterized protein LOC126672637 [Mercurialis annua]
MPRPSYMKPYPDWIDKLYPFPRGYKVPEFSLFSGEEKVQSTVEHVARLSAQYGEAGAHNFWKLRLFASSLTKITFTWYSHLSPNSIGSWKDLETKFHEEFYIAAPDVTLDDLARISQLPSETVEKYISRFRNLRTRCMTQISEGDCVPMVVKGMNFSMREHFKGHHFRDLFELTNRVTSYKRLLQEKEQRRGSSKGTYYRDQLDVAVISDSEDDSSDDEVCMAEFLGKNPTECAALKKPGYMKKNKVLIIRKEYSFDLTKADEIFDALLKDG